MKDYKSHSEKVSKCLHAIHAELTKHNFAKKGKVYKERIEQIVIADMAQKFGLKYKNIKTIYYGKLATSY